MNRSTLLLPFVVLLTACKVERTPEHYYNQQKPSASEQNQSIGEMRARVRAFAAALGRGRAGAAASALAPTADVRVFGLGEDGGTMLTGAEGLRRAVAEIDAPAPLLARTPDLTVQTTPRGTMGWFATHLEILPEGPQGAFERLRLSGTFVRDQGQWRLAELHLSRATPSPAPASPNPPRDSLPPAAE